MIALTKFSKYLMGLKINLMNLIKYYQIRHGFIFTFIGRKLVDQEGFACVMALKMGFIGFWKILSF
jgi:hypothetical protein